MIEFTCVGQNECFFQEQLADLYRGGSPQTCPRNPFSETDYPLTYLQNPLSTVCHPSPAAENSFSETVHLVHFSLALFVLMFVFLAFPMRFRIIGCSGYPGPSIFHLGAGCRSIVSVGGGCHDSDSLCGVDCQDRDSNSHVLGCLCCCQTRTSVQTA